MSSFDIHFEKYEMFKKDAEITGVSDPLKIEAYFYSSFHVIEAVNAKHAVHINKHQHTRRVLEENEQVFGDHTESVWRAFQEIENQIRPGQVYGGSTNGKKLKRARNLFHQIEEICIGLIKQNDID